MRSYRKPRKLTTIEVIYGMVVLGLILWMIFDSVAHGGGNSIE